MSYNSLHGLGTHSADASVICDFLMGDNAASTQITDRSGNANHATNFANTDTKQTGAGNGWFTSSIQYNGSNDRSVMSGTVGATTFSWAGWVKVESSSKDGAVVAAFANTNNSIRRFLVWHDVNGAADGFAVVSYDGGSANDIDGADNNDNALNNWRHVALVRNLSGASVYVDGVNTATVSFTSSATDEEVTLGANYGDSNSTFARYLNGELGPNASFSDELTADEILEDMGGPEPLNLTAPTVTGAYRVGETLSTTDGTWDSQANGVITYTYQWQVADDASGTNAADINGATASTWQLRAAQSGKYVRCLVSASNDGGVDSAEDTAGAWTLVEAGVSPSYNELFGLGNWSSPDADLQGWWKLDDNTASTTVTDYSGNANHGTLQGGSNTSDLASTSISPYLTNSLAFDGSADYVDLPINFAAYPYTLGARVRNDGGKAFIFAQGYSASTSVYYAATTNSGVYAVNVRNTVNRRVVGTTAYGGVDSVAVVMDNNNDQSLFVNGVSEATQTVTTTQNSSVDQMAIGALLRATPSNYFQGPISDAFAFSRSLTASELSEADAGPEPLNLTAPTVSGTHETGETLTATDGTWDSQANGTITYTYQWQRADDAIGTNAVNIGGATASTYLLTASEENKYVRVAVAASNDGGNDSAEDTGSTWTESTSAGGGGPTFKPFFAINATRIAR